jgi:hypothetical protein
MNRALLASLGLALAAMACGGNKTFPSLCANQVPPPAACATRCDNAPGAANTCPAGYFCSADGKCDAQCTLTGGQCGDGYSCTGDGRCVMGNGGCTGIQCNIADCASMGKQPTTITGTVFAPNGTLPLFGINVYVPNSDPGPIKPGVQCGACSDGLPGNPIIQAVTDEAGKFTLQSIPDGDNIPLVITTGKWRRQIKIPKVNACATQAISVADTTLPKSKDDMTGNTMSVDMPQIAISTGSKDSLECLVRRLGIADKEITTDKEAGKIHLFADLGSGGGVGTTKFDASFAGGSRAFSDSKTLWGTTATDPGKLGSYDIVILSCEGGQHVETKSQDAMNRLKAYADLGGRVFLSHWHNIWIEGSTTGAGNNGSKPAVWPTLAQWSNSDTTLGDGTNDTIDEQHNPKGSSFATWMQNVNVITPPPMRDAIPLENGTGKSTAISVDNNNVEQWVYLQKDPTTRVTQNFQFSTPSEKPLENRCGKVVFSDMHVSGGPAATNPDDNKTIFAYPQSCGADTDLSPQEKALAFMFFDISSCVGAIF